VRADTPMVVECDTCPVRHVRCDDCMVTALRSLPVVPLLRLADGEMPLDPAEERAVARLVAAGLVSPDEAMTVTARHEPWSGVAAVG
jgi:hypothetical protein